MIEKVSWMSRKKVFSPALWDNHPIFNTKFFILEIAFDEGKDSLYYPEKLFFGGAGKRPKRKQEPVCGFFPSSC
jgi:hypothetical protein